MNHYPPLKALIAFDAAMRHRSFSLAADEMCVTPGAIGQHIRKLEEWLGMPLFVRQVRQILPTDAATGYWQTIQPALARIADASQRLRQSRSQTVSLSMPPSFAAKWFTPRLTTVLTRHPGLELHLKASPAPVDFERETVDLAIRHFDGHDESLDATLLLRDDIRVYCSPAYAAAQRLSAPDALTNASLLVTTLHPHWERWFEQFSTLGTTTVANIPRLHFDQSLMAIEAARHGHGAVLTSRHLTETEIASNSLIEPFPCRLQSGQGYYVVHPRKLSLSPTAALVRQWLIDTAAQDAPSD